LNFVRASIIFLDNSYCQVFFTKDAGLALAACPLGGLGARAPASSSRLTNNNNHPHKRAKLRQRRANRAAKMASTSSDTIINNAALNRLDVLDADQYIIALGPEGRQFLGTPNGYSA
jgi:hypothetical protein